MSDPLVAAVLTPAQQETVESFRAFNVAASWFVGVPDTDGRVEVLALGEDFIWSIRVAPDGSSDTSEAKVGDFETGVSC